MSAVPMFPLGTVLVPGMLLPLHVFEARYRQMVRDCMAEDGRFGVVLIERGSEVGGGDVRTDVGTLAGVVQAEEQSDGRWLLAAAGLHRIRVERWLPDDPYPRAEVAAWPDEPDEPDEDAAVGVATREWADVVRLLRRASAMRREMGEPAPPLDLELPEGPGIGGFAAVGVAPLGPADRQRLLEVPTTAARVALLRELLADEVEVLRARLADG